jgi:hypothetical protein
MDGPASDELRIAHLSASFPHLRFSLRWGIMRAGNMLDVLDGGGSLPPDLTAPWYLNETNLIMSQRRALGW